MCLILLHVSKIKPICIWTWGSEANKLNIKKEAYHECYCTSQCGFPPEAACKELYCIPDCHGESFHSVYIS